MEFLSKEAAAVNLIPDQGVFFCQGGTWDLRHYTLKPLPIPCGPPQLLTSLLLPTSSSKLINHAPVATCKAEKLEAPAAPKTDFLSPSSARPDQSRGTQASCRTLHMGT